MYKRYFASLIELFILINGVFLPIVLILGSIVPISSQDFLFYVLSLIGWTIIFLKDIFQGASPFKKIFGLKVIDIKSNHAATPLKTLLRNSTLILLLPIEMIVMFFSPQRRIGDLIAKTRLIEVDKIPIKQFKSFFHLDSKINVWIIIAIAVGLVIIETFVYLTLFINLRNLIEAMHTID